MTDRSPYCLQTVAPVSRAMERALRALYGLRLQVNRGVRRHEWLVGCVTRPARAGLRR